MSPTTPTTDDLRVTSNSLRDLQSVVSARRPSDPERSEDKELLSLAQERFGLICASESDWRKQADKELQFVDALEHWDSGQKEERKGHPCLTFDRIGPSIDQVVNDARQNPPEPKVSPIGGGADKDTAELLQGMLRNIDQDSSAIIAYLTAYEHAVKIGRGWWRVHFEYENDIDIDDTSFQQKIVVKRVRNPFSIYPDPAAEEFDYSDMEFCFATEDVSMELFKRLHPDSVTAGFSSFESMGDRIKKDWFPRGSVRIAEYWWVETAIQKIVQTNDGKVMLAKDAPEGAVIINQRDRKVRKVRGAKITAAEVLERWEWPGRFIPIIPVLGKEIIKDSQISLRGMIRAAMDSNLTFDYVMSKEVETIGLSSIVQWMVAEGQIENFEYQWAQANRKSLPFIEYKSEVGGKPVLPPQRIASTPPLGAISESIAHMDEATKMNLSTWNPSLGDAPPEASGRAITARARESDNAHFNYHDNLMRSLRFSSRVELDLIPHIYSEQRIVTVLNPDGSNKQVTINGPTMHQGIAKIFSTKGAARCDVTYGAGPSYASRRAEGADKLMQIVPAMPVLLQRAPDLIIKALDIPEGDLIADRVRPPDVQADAEGQAPLPPQVQAQLAQQNAMIQALTAHAAALEQVLKAKVVELESKERMNTQTNLTRAYTAEVLAKNAQMNQLAQLDHAKEQAELDRRADLLNTHLGLVADVAQTDAGLIAAQQQQQQEQQHDAQQAAQAQQGAQSLQDSQHQHEQNMQASAPPPAPKAA